MKAGFRIGILRNTIAVLFVLLLCLGLYGAYMWTEQTTIVPSSYAHAGKIIKENFPEYASSSNDEIGRTVFSKGYLSDDQRSVLHARGMSDADIDGLVERKGYLPSQKALVYAIVVTVWAALFAIILNGIRSFK